MARNPRRGNPIGLQKAIDSAIGGKGGSGKPSKWRNVRCEDSDGRKFASKMERDCILAIEDVLGKERVMRQVSIIVDDGPNPVRYVADAMIKLHGEVFLLDVKGGPTTATFRLKEKLLNNNTVLPLHIVRNVAEAVALAEDCKKALWKRVNPFGEDE